MSRNIKEKAMTYIFVGLIVATFLVLGLVVRWVYIEKIPCSFVTVSEAPLRCLESGLR